ncbi:fas apoptotic inhibitory molecule 1 [Daktulosphaira vitifoliae]|uniref:fas apoptotic inhibitory molecule 1 n=1 Tax=Daktulosphaira vitifoliae TaxID=58002 RepID=UPI0021AAB5FE|nr:fas apoptotic inhibitory molecule 1 [Daktulosphaira vitifoliae]
MSEKKKNSDDIVAVWKVPLAGGVHEVEFEHGTATGKRVIRLDGRIIRRKEWMFRLIGDEIFNIENTQCIIRVEPDGLFMYTYSLLVDGKPLNNYCEYMSKTRSVWIVSTDGVDKRITLDKETMDIFIDGVKITDTMPEFIDNGTQTHFFIGEVMATLKTVHSGDKKVGVVHNIFIDGKQIKEL